MNSTNNTCQFEGGIFDEGLETGIVICKCPSLASSPDEVQEAFQICSFILLAFGTAFAIFIVWKTVKEAKIMKERIDAMHEEEMNRIIAPPRISSTSTQVDRSSYKRKESDWGVTLNANRRQSTLTPAVNEDVMDMYDILPQQYTMDPIAETDEDSRELGSKVDSYGNFSASSFGGPILPTWNGVDENQESARSAEAMLRVLFCDHTGMDDMCETEEKARKKQKSSVENAVKRVRNSVIFSWNKEEDDQISRDDDDVFDTEKGVGYVGGRKKRRRSKQMSEPERQLIANMFSRGRRRSSDAGIASFEALRLKRKMQFLRSTSNSSMVDIEEQAPKVSVVNEKSGEGSHGYDETAFKKKLAYWQAFR